MEKILWDDVVFKLRKTRQKLALSLTPLGAVRAAAEGTGYKNRRLGKSRGVRFDSRLDWSRLYGAIRTEPETAAQSSCSHFWTSLRTLCCLSSAWIVVGAVTVTPAENFVSPLSESSPPRKHLKKKKKKKKSVSPHDSLAVLPDPSERSPTLPSSSGLCVRQIENEQQSTVGEVSQPLEVMALARRLAGPDNAVPSLPGSNSWLSKKKQKKSEACSCTSWCSQATF